MNGFIFTALLSALAAASASVSFAESSMDATDKIIGDNSLTPVSSTLSGLDQLEQNIAAAVGRLVIIDPQTLRAAGYCTVTHIGNGLAVTAGHCVLPEEGGTLKDAPCTQIKAQWGYREGRVDSVAQCTRVIAAEKTATTDYAILRFEKGPASFLRVARSRPAIGTSIVIFSHPRGRALEFSAPCQVVNNAAPAYIAGQKFFQHQCDTEPGSSGAAVVDVASGRIVGLHSSGLLNFDANLAMATASVPYFAPKSPQ